MGAASKVLAVAVIGLTVVGCGLTAEQRREVAQRAADDSRCRSYGFKTDADLARLRRSSAGGDHAGGATPDTNSLSLSLLCRDAIARRDSVSMLATC